MWSGGGATSREGKHANWEGNNHHGAPVALVQIDGFDGIGGQVWGRPQLVVGRQLWRSAQNGLSARARLAQAQQRERERGMRMIAPECCREGPSGALPAGPVPVELPREAEAQAEKACASGGSLGGSFVRPSGSERRLRGADLAAGAHGRPGAD